MPVGLVRLREVSAGAESLDKHVVRAIMEKDGKVLFLRNDYPEENLSFLELPGGNLESKRKAGRTEWENPLDGLVREVLEETGRRVLTATYIGSLDYPSTRTGLPTRQSFYVAEVGEASEPVMEGEIGQMVWLGREEFSRPDIREKSGIAVRYWDLSVYRRP